MIHSQNEVTRADLDKIGWKVHEGAEVWDGQWCLIARDQQTGDTLWSFEEDGKIHFRMQQDVEGLLERNAIIREGTEGRRFGDYRLIGSVPDGIAASSGLDEAYRQKDMKFVKRFFNDGANDKFRASRGKV